MFALPSLMVTRREASAVPLIVLSLVWLLTVVSAPPKLLMVSVGASVSTGCTLLVAAVLLLPAASIATPAATLAVTLPSKPAVGVTTRV